MSAKNFAIFWVVFPLMWAWGVGVCRIIAGFLKSKPLLQQTLIDLVKRDLVFGHTATISAFAICFYAEYLWEIPLVPFLVLSWASRFWAFFTVLYATHVIIVRYVYVYNQERSLIF